jgi:hypothetical protein
MPPSSRSAFVYATRPGRKLRVITGVPGGKTFLIDRIADA